jgi:hypothetical protein
MNINEIIELARVYLDETTADYASGSGDFSNSEILLCANQEHDHLFAKMRQSNEDWFGREYVFLTSSTLLKYYLPIDLVSDRRVEVISSSYVSGTSPFFVVNEATVEPTELASQGMNEAFGDYYFKDNQICFVSTTYLSSTNYIRLFYTPTAPKLHRCTAQAGGTSTITLGLSTDPQMLGSVKTINNYYKGMIVEIISGLGAGQRKWITQYVASTKVATVDSAWDTTPNNTSVYCIVSPIIDDYHELIALGAVIRLKGIKTEDDPGVVAQLYSTVKTEFEKTISSRNKHGVKRVKQTNWE